MELLFRIMAEVCGEPLPIVRIQGISEGLKIYIPRGFQLPVVFVE